jgi:hypothetical protein
MYLSLGYIAKSVRSQAYLRAWKLIALIPVPTKEDLASLKTVNTSTTMEQDFRREVLHGSVKFVLEKLKPYAIRYYRCPLYLFVSFRHLISFISELFLFIRRGAEMKTPEGHTIYSFFRLAAYVCDYEEAYRLSGVKNQWWYHCEIPKSLLSDMTTKWKLRHQKRYESLVSASVCLVYKKTH